jgi:hypothetical protein
LDGLDSPVVRTRIAPRETIPPRLIRRPPPVTRDCPESVKISQFDGKILGIFSIRPARSQKSTANSTSYSANSRSGSRKIIRHKWELNKPNWEYREITDPPLPLLYLTTDVAEDLDINMAAMPDLNAPAASPPTRRNYARPPGPLPDRNPIEAFFIDGQIVSGSARAARRAGWPSAGRQAAAAARPRRDRSCDAHLTGSRKPDFCAGK